jgi:outer membrane lipopolysaccharide assembly protein LptE/RlpB
MTAAVADSRQILGARGARGRVARLHTFIARVNPYVFAGLAIFAPLLLVGCGYHTAGHATRLPQQLKTIAVPAFKNNTQTYRIEQTLTSAVVREFNTRTRYRIVYDAGSDADAVLRGTVLNAGSSTLTYDAQTGRASTMLVTVNASVQLVDRKGVVLYDNPNYTFREQYQVSREISSFFEEDSAALDRLSRDFARTLVSNILEAY